LSGHQIYCPPSGYSADFVAPLAGTAVKPNANPCSLKLSKSTREFTLDCKSMKTLTLATVDVYFAQPGSASGAGGAGGAGRRLLGCSGVAAGAPLWAAGAAPASGAATPQDTTVTPQGDHLQMWIVLKGSSVKGTALLADASILS
jgi:hypothetical protein